MTELANLAAALVAFQSAMPTVKKSQKANVPTKSGGSYSYTYAGLADVMREAMPLLTQHGLAFTALPRQSERGYELVGTLLHASGERVEGALPLNGNTPQELGSSLTYMRRYLFGCLTGLVTDDDDDGQTATKAARRPPARKPADVSDAEVLPGGPITERTRKQMFALFGDQGIPDGDQLAGINAINGTAHTSRSQVTEAEARTVIDALHARAAS